jgi:hypothetical protein
MCQSPGRRDVLQAPQPPPDRLDAWFSIALAPQELTQLGNPAHGFAQAGRLSRRMGRSMNGTVHRLPLRKGQDRGSGCLWMRAGLIGHPEQPPGNQTIDRQRPLQTYCRFQLQGFEPAAAFEDEMIPLDEPAQGIPLDTGHRLGPGGDGQRRDQQPTEGRDVGGRVHFFGQDHLERERLPALRLSSVSRGEPPPDWPSAPRASPAASDAPVLAAPPPASAHPAAFGGWLPTDTGPLA